MLFWTVKKSKQKPNLNLNYTIGYLWTGLLSDTLRHLNGGGELIIAIWLINSATCKPCTRCKTVVFTSYDCKQMAWHLNWSLRRIWQYFDIIFKKWGKKVTEMIINKWFEFVKILIGQISFFFSYALTLSLVVVAAFYHCHCFLMQFQTQRKSNSNSNWKKNCFYVLWKRTL